MYLAGSPQLLSFLICQVLQNLPDYQNQIRMWYRPVRMTSNFKPSSCLCWFPRNVCLKRISKHSAVVRQSARFVRIICPNWVILIWPQILYTTPVTQNILTKQEHERIRIFNLHKNLKKKRVLILICNIFFNLNGKA